MTTGRADTRTPLQKWWRKRPLFRARVLLHRWPALILGLFLVIETTWLYRRGVKKRRKQAGLLMLTDAQLEAAVAEDEVPTKA